VNVPEHLIICILQTNPGRELLKEIQLTDEDLVMIETKDLNKLIKEKSIKKAQATKIKAHRRTLKNRYAKFISKIDHSIL
jgi:hypothetical protein